MKILSIHDNGGRSFDRYTVVLKEKYDIAGTLNYCLGLSDYPDNYQGFSQFSSCQPGRHLGKKIAFTALPETIQNHIKQRLA